MSPGEALQVESKEPKAQPIKVDQGATRLAAQRGALLAARRHHGLGRGFWHFGEFSRAYRECLGEVPSETLRRRPGPSGGRR